MLAAFDDGDLLIEEALFVGHRLEHAVEDIIEELLLSGDDKYEGFDIIEVDVRRSINRNGNGRTGVEVIITNGYESRIGR